MADSVYIPGLAARGRESSSVPRHSAMVRVTHWVHALSLVGLVVSGVGILVAHPRFYWGETGGVGMPSLFDLPLPFLLGGPSGWGRSLHFQSAWVCVLTGLVYVASGLLNRHFSGDLSPVKEDPGDGYNLLQRITYLAVIFFLLPLMIWTGLAMSPGFNSAVPATVNLLGGRQSARTLHFAVSIALLLFLVVHIAMVVLAGFGSRMRAMITGRVAVPEERR